jgi:TonB family protein
VSKLRGICILVMCFASPAFAQSGPMSARMVFAKPPPLFEYSRGDSGRRTTVVLDIDAAGKVTNVQVVNPSDSPDYDKKVQKYYSQWRFLPALDQQGTPIASHLKVVYVTGDADSPDTLGQTTATTAPVTDSKDTRIYDEASRIMRMRCKDFLWEHDFMRDIAGAKSRLTNEQMVKTSMAIFMVQANVTAEEFKKLDRNYSRTLREAAGTCRNRPDDKYYEQVLAPALKSQLGR